MSAVKTTAWQDRSAELASWAMTRLVNRTDRHGQYRDDGNAFTADRLSETGLKTHFDGGPLIGLHTTSPDNKCRWLVFDFDNHSEDPDVKINNFEAAMHICNQLTKLDVSWLLEDSDGQGGFHIWILFSDAAPAKAVHRFGQWLNGESGHEVFPKQPELTGGELGNFMRIPGRHHKRDHWSRFWGDGNWLNDDASVERLMNARANDPLVLKQAPEEAVVPPVVESDVRLSPDTSEKPSNVITVAEEYFDKQPWSDLLENQGWKQVGQQDGKSTWTRPDKDSGVSATVDFNGNGKLHVFSTNSDLPHDKSYGKFRFLMYSGGFDDRRQVEAAKELLPAEIVKENDRLWHVWKNKSGDNDEKRTYEGVTISQLWPLADEPIEWLVDEVFSADQPTIFGAKQKAMKTTMLSDLAVCLATGLPWLRTFEIPKRRSVLIITGEASQKAAIRKVRSAAESLNLTRHDFEDTLRIEAINFPRLPSADDCVSVQQAVTAHNIEVVILDPLYMGLEGLNTTNLTEVGPVLRNFMKHCQPASVIIAHHVKKTASFDDAPNLEDLSQAGIAEFAGNYWLMGRIGEYTGDGMHELAVRYGGREGHFGMKKIDFNEFSWTFESSDLLEYRKQTVAREEKQRAATKAERYHQKIEQARASIMAAMRNVKEPTSKRAIEGRTGGATQSSFREAFADMEIDQTISTHAYRDSMDRLQSCGYLLAEYGPEYEEKFKQSEVAREQSEDPKQSKGDPKESEDPR